MKYVTQAIRAVYPGWEGVVHFDAQGGIERVEPNQGRAMPDMSAVQAAHVQVEKDMQTQSQIAALEQDITPRRLREALLGTDNGWLAQQEAAIQTLRAKL